MDYQRYRVSASAREPLLRFILDALRGCGCRIIRASPPIEAPFRISAEAPDGERFGIIAYAFLANAKPTRNRPNDEHRLQVKYGPKVLDAGLPKFHDLWQDPFGLYTTLLVGINPERGFFVGFDPVLHSPTKFFISLEFKEEQVQQILRHGWHSWERSTRQGSVDEPVEVVVGGTPATFLHYARFERLAAELQDGDQGHRGLLADRLPRLQGAGTRAVGPVIEGGALSEHPLLSELQLQPDELLDLIANARRLKMAVRGWAAEEHLHRMLGSLPGIAERARLDDEGGPDLRVRLQAGPMLTIECKNVLRHVQAGGLPRIDFMRTRPSRKDPCSRFYRPTDFDVVAACLHAATERWEFRFRRTVDLPPHQRCPGRVQNRLPIDESWLTDPMPVLRAAAGLPA